MYRMYTYIVIESTVSLFFGILVVVLTIWSICKETSPSIKYQRDISMHSQHRIDSVSRPLIKRGSGSRKNLKKRAFIHHVPYTIRRMLLVNSVLLGGRCVRLINTDGWCYVVWVFASDYATSLLMLSAGIIALQFLRVIEKTLALRQPPYFITVAYITTVLLLIVPGVCDGVVLWTHHSWAYGVAHIFYIVVELVWTSMFWKSYFTLRRVSPKSFQKLFYLLVFGLALLVVAIPFQVYKSYTYFSFDPNDDYPHEHGSFSEVTFAVMVGIGMLAELRFVW